MAALQTIRSKGALLIGALGLALFAFIAEESFRSLETTSAMERSQVGEVFGEKLSIQDYQQMVDEQAEITRLQMAMQGQNGNISDAQMESIREQVWQQFVSDQVIKHECEKLGLYVTDGEMQEALRLGQARSLQMVASIFGNPQTGRFDLAQLQNFLKEYTKALGQAQQAQNAEAVEQIQMIKKMWDFSEKQLRQELLANKYNMLFALGFNANPIAAKANYNDRNVQKNVNIAALPYATVKDESIKVTDEDLQAAYKQHKENFFVGTATRDVKLIDVNVVASAADRAELTKRVASFEEKLRSGANVADVVRSANSEVQYTNLAMSKGAFVSMPDVAAHLDSMTVGGVKATYYNAQDNTINTLKLIAKEQAPDSILFRQISAVAATPEARKAQADSILKALNGGASFAELAKKYGQASDSVWLTSNQYETFGMPEETAKYLNNLYQIGANSAKVVSNEQGAAVVQVLDRKKMVTKYNVAVVKCPLNFSKKTYEDELSRLNRFLAQNKDIPSIEKNAAKNGYMLYDLPGYSPFQNVIPARIGGSQAKDCARWIFDEAEAGNVSRLYECGRNGDHLVVACVTATNDDQFLPWSNPDVKNFLTMIVKQQKKAEKALATAKNVKTTADMQKLAGAVTASLSNQAFTSYPVVTGVNTPELKLAGVIAKTAPGKTSSLVQGAAAVYVVQVTGEIKPTEKYDEAAEISQVSNSIGQRCYNATFNYLMSRKSEMVDHRYQF